MVTAYLGFDATAPSLHVGSLLQIMILRHLQRSGHKPIVLLGGGTTKVCGVCLATEPAGFAIKRDCGFWQVGDPTGKDTSRKMLSEAEIASNIAGIA